MKKQQTQSTEKKLQFRAAVVRKLARPLTDDELQEVAGGMPRSYPTFDVCG